MGSSETRKVVEEVSGWLRVFDDGTVDRTWTGPPEALFLMDSVPPYDVPRDGITVHDIAGNPSVRVYVPTQGRGNGNGNGNGIGKLPLLVHFHGGGFCISHATWLMYHQFYSRVASSIPAIVVSPFLPLAPENRLPAAIDACYDALLWLRKLAMSAPAAAVAAGSLWESAADFSRVFLIGDSSGGNLVHAVAARAGEAEEGFWLPMRVAGGIPIHPGFVRSSRSKSELEGKPDPFLTLDMLDKFLALALPEESSKDHPITCPMGEGAAPPLEGLRLPPFLVFVAAGDLIRDTNLEYCEAMKRAGKDVEVFVSQGIGHSFYLNKMAVDMDPTTGKRCQELILAIKDFVDRH